MEFLSAYGLFLAKVITLVISILFVISGILTIAIKNKKKKELSLEVEKLNDDLNEKADILNSAILSKDDYKNMKKTETKQKKLNKKNKKAEDNKKEDKQKIFVLDFYGDIKANEVDFLREEITALLTIAQNKDKIFIKLESCGGLVHAYGLAASQLQRIKDKEIELIISIDKVAASGGYMMACVANKVIAAPFAIVGSIGVIGQIPNFNRLLKRNNIDFEQHTAGEYKRTLTMLGKNTEAGRKKFISELEDTHLLFKNFINTDRPSLELDKVATGEYWYGTKALELGLIDKIQTSDDYLIQACKNADVYSISYQPPKSIRDKLSEAFGSSIQKVWDLACQKQNDSNFIK